jgi:hypothetical protein
MVLIHDNLYFENINKLNEGLDTELLTQTPNKVNSNVAIAGAITAYARIHMMKIKCLPNVEIFYTDTDSFFIVGDIPKHLLSQSEIGLFKNELEYKDNGIIKTHKIVKAYFFE